MGTNGHHAVYAAAPENSILFHQNQAVTLLGNLTASNPEGHRLGLAKICALLAGGAYSRLAADLAERYVSAGLRFLERQQDDLTLARLYQLRGNCFGLRGDYDRARYYSPVPLLRPQL